MVELVGGQAQEECRLRWLERRWWEEAKRDLPRAGTELEHSIRCFLYTRFMLGHCWRLLCALLRSSRFYDNACQRLIPNNFQVWLRERLHLSR